MSDFDPKKYLAEKAAEAEFDPKAYLAEKTGAAEGSPLERALAEQTGDVVTVETPTGPAQFDRQGRRVMSPEESQQMADAGGARLKERALEAGLSFASGGGPLMDELSGINQAISPETLAAFARGEGPSPAVKYASVRDSTRRDVANATRRASPTVNVGGVEIPVLPVLGSAVTAMAAPLPLGALGRIVSGGFQGVLSAAGQSEADLLKGEGGQLARDVGMGLGTGLAASGLAEGVAAPVRWAAGRMGNEAGLAANAAQEGMQATADKSVRSTTSAMGGVAAGGGNSLETLSEILAQPARFDPAVVARAQQMAARPEIQAALNRAASGNLDKLERFIPAYSAAEQAQQGAVAAAQPSVVGAAAAERLAPGAVAADVGSKFMRSVGQRAALGAAGSGLGAGAAWLTGTDPKIGAGIGASAGFLPQGALQFARNQAASPFVQSAVNQGGQALMQGAAGGMGRVAGAVAPSMEAARPVGIEEEELRSIDAFMRGN